MAARLASALSTSESVASVAGLTARETEVLGLIGQGMSNAEIGARNRADAVRYALRHGLAST